MLAMRAGHKYYLDFFSKSINNTQTFFAVGDKFIDPSNQKVSEFLSADYEQ